MAYVPGFLASLAVVVTLSLAVAGTVVGWLLVAAWLFAGALTFHRPTERFLARHVLKLRPPEPAEWARLAPVWHEVTGRGGIESGTYELMVENSDDLNAKAVAGHIVGVTTYALANVPTSHLAAVLAHELGHHVGGHSWASLLGYWYSLPGRIAWQAAALLAVGVVFVAARISALVAVVIGILLVIAAVALFIIYWPLVLAMIAAPYFLAYAARKSEFRADQQAAALGFALQMVEVLHHLRVQEAQQRARARAAGERSVGSPGTLARLLSDHPNHEMRLRALAPHLAVGR